MSKQIEVRGRTLGGQCPPLVCTPLVGSSREAVLAELERILAKGPDLLEWRVDFFRGIRDSRQVLELAQAIREQAGDLPVLFTRRSIREGGEPIDLTEEQVMDLYTQVCASGTVDLLDLEMSSESAHLERMRDVTRQHDVKLVLSYHNFQATPSLEEIGQRFHRAQSLGADVAKVAVMPRSLDDVLVLLTATLQAFRQLDIPVISMSMGGHGSLSRLFGWIFGSAVSFAVGDKASAPGQVPIEDLRTAVAIAKRAIGVEDRK